jgi:hypothetical protein
MLGLDKYSIKKAFKSLKHAKGDKTVDREPYTDEQLDVYASRVKWHPYLSSLMYFLLTCAGRA